MAEELDSKYWLGRELAQRKMEAAATDPAVKHIHRAIADSHADKAWHEDEVEAPEHNTKVSVQSSQP